MIEVVDFALCFDEKQKLFHYLFDKIMSCITPKTNPKSSRTMEKMGEVFSFESIR